jgi:hypothetical protein
MSVLIRASLLAVTLAAVSTGTLAFDLSGNPITQLAPAEARAIVLFFAASDCPISNRYIPEMQRLTKQYEPAGVRIWFVYPNPGDNANVIRAHNLEFAITANSALDTTQNLVHLAGATVTPEVAILVPERGSLRPVYRGRIDDRYLALGTERPLAVHHDLEQAIRAVLAAKPVPPPGGPSIGCSIVALKP